MEPGMSSAETPVRTTSMELLVTTNGAKDAQVSESASSHGATLQSTMLNLVNTMLGTGLLGFPAAFAACGMTLGTCVLIAAAVASDFSLRLLGSCSLWRPGCTFRGLSEESLPTALHSLADVAITVMCIGGGCAAKLIVIGDSLPIVTRFIAPALPSDSIFLMRQFWIVLLSLGITLPLVLQRSLHALRHVGLFSLACVAYIAIIVCIYAIREPHASSLDTSSKSDMSMLRALPVFIYGFTCQQNMVQLVQELRPEVRNRATVSRAVHGALGTCLLLYAGIAVAGFVAFGPDVSSNMTNSLPNTLPAAIGRIMLSIALAFNFPLWAHPVRASLCRLVLQKSILAPDILYWRHFVPLSLAVWALPLILALLLQDLGVALAVVGGTGCTIVSYILPGAYYCAISRGNFTPAGHAPQRRPWTWWLAAGLTSSGVALVPMSVVMILIK